VESHVEFGLLQKVTPQSLNIPLLCKELEICNKNGTHTVFL
jgi:hypothetical protein